MVDLGFKEKKKNLGLAKSAKVHAIHVGLGGPPRLGLVFDRFFGSLGCEAGKQISRISNKTPANQLKIWKAIFWGNRKTDMDVFFHEIHEW